MKPSRPPAPVLAALALVAALALGAAPASAQCAMCQTALTNSAEGRGLSQEFNRAILVMLCAPYAVFASVGLVLLRRRIRARLERAASRLRRALPPAPPLRIH